MTRPVVPSKPVLIAVAAALFVIFFVAFRYYLNVAPFTAGGYLVLAVWAVALLGCFECLILMRQAKRPFEMGVYTFALIYGACVVLLHWIWGGIL